MEKDCPKCGQIMCGEAPDDPWYIHYMCDECGYDEGENIIGELTDYAMEQRGER